MVARRRQVLDQMSPTPKTSASTTDPPCPALVAVLDADVLVPILSCDLLLSAFDDDLYQPVVTGRILDEIERNLAADFAHLDPVALRRRGSQVAQALAFHTHHDGEPTDAVATVNRKDRHVAAVALASKADLVVSNDRRLRREINQLDPPLRAVTADDLMVGLHDADRDGVDDVIDTIVAKRVRRPVTRAELIDQLAATFPGFAAALAGGG